MKRMHVHVSVDNLQQSVAFYSALFAAKPSVVKTDYAKWMLDDPRVNFAISARGRQVGLDHLGIQVEDKDELNEVYARLHTAGGNVIEQGQTNCCYAKSEKSWSTIQPALRGRRSWPLAKVPTTAMASAKRASRAPRRAARLSPRRLKLLLAAVRVSETRNDRSTLQRTVSLHGQFRALDYGGSHFE
jgi:catechol 2,3-dioxygenase-like lactoylglutathione lyase family enzyme